MAAKQLGIGADVYFAEDRNKYDAPTKEKAAKPAERQAAYAQKGGLSSPSETSKPELTPLSKSWNSAVAKAAGSRNSDEVLLAHIRKEAEELGSDRNITVMMGSLVVTNPLKKVLHNSTTHRLMGKLEKYRNVSVFTVPYII